MEKSIKVSVHLQELQSLKMQSAGVRCAAGLARVAGRVGGANGVLVAARTSLHTARPAFAAVTTVA